MLSFHWFRMLCFISDTLYIRYNYIFLNLHDLQTVTLLLSWYFIKGLITPWYSIRPLGFKPNANPHLEFCQVLVICFDKISLFFFSFFSSVEVDVLRDCYQHVSKRIIWSSFKLLYVCSIFLIFPFFNHPNFPHISNSLKPLLI